MINNETFSIELYSLTKLYLMLDELDEKEQVLVRLRENNKNIDTSEYESKKMSKLAGAVDLYNRAFYSIFFAPLENRSEDLEFGRFAKAFYFDYKKFVEQYLMRNRDRVINEFYSFSQGKYIKLSKDDVTNIVDDFIKCILWLITNNDMLKKYPNFITNNDNKKAVLEKLLSRTMVEYYKSLSRTQSELPLMQFCHFGKEYNLPIKHAVEYSPSCKPINIFLLFMNYYKPFNANSNTTSREIDWGEALKELNLRKKERLENKPTIIKAPNNQPFELTNELKTQLNVLHSNSEGCRLRAMETVRALDSDIEKIKAQKTILNESLKAMLNAIAEIPPYYATNSDAVKKMCFLYVNKRANNLQDLINIYETEEWRRKVISSIADFRNVIALASINLSRQLSNIQSGVINNNKALYALTNKINDLKIDVDVAVDVKVDNDGK